MQKSAESPLLRAAANVFGTGMLLSDQQDAREAVRQAALEELMARQAEAQRMAPVRRGLKPAGGIAPDTTDYASAGSFRDYESGLPLALSFEKDGELNKEALNLLGGAKMLAGKLLQAGGGVSKGVGRAVGAAGTGLGAAGQALGSVAKPGIGQQAAGFLQGAGQKVQNAALGIGVAGQNVAQGGRAMAQGALKPAAQVAQTASKPLISGMTKAKMLGTAGVLGAGYLGYKGLQAGRDYMSVPAGQHHQGYLRSGVSPYGY